MRWGHWTRLAQAVFAAAAVAFIASIEDFHTVTSFCGRAWRRTGTRLHRFLLCHRAWKSTRHQSFVGRQCFFSLSVLDQFFSVVCCCYADAFCCSRMFSLPDQAYHYIQCVSFRCNLHIVQNCHVFSVI